MASRNKREDIKWNAILGSDIFDYISENKDKEYIEISTFESFVDDIESDLKTIEDLLQPIEGLSEIDEVKEKLQELLDELY